MPLKLSLYIAFFCFSVTFPTAYGQVDTIAVETDTIVIEIDTIAIQTPPVAGQVDTIIDGKTFNYVSWYDNGHLHELGNILIKGSTSIKQGYWIVYDDSTALIEKGAYQKNKKTGLWTERGSDNTCCWRGSYKKNKKHGQWSNGFNRIIIYKNGKKKSSEIVHWRQ